MEDAALAVRVRKRLRPPAEAETEMNEKNAREDVLMDAGAPWKLRTAAGRGPEAIRESARAAAVSARSYGQLACVMRDLVAATGAGDRHCLLDALAQHAQRSCSIAAMDEVHARRCATTGSGEWKSVVPAWVRDLRGSARAMDHAASLAARHSSTDGAVLCVPQKPLPAAVALSCSGAGRHAAEGEALHRNLLVSGDPDAFANHCATAVAAAASRPKRARRAGASDDAPPRLGDGASQWVFLASHAAAARTLASRADLGPIGAIDPVAATLDRSHKAVVQSRGFWLAALSQTAGRLRPGSPPHRLATILAHALASCQFDARAVTEASNLVHRHVRVLTERDAAGGAHAAADDDDDSSDDEDNVEMEVEVEEEEEVGAVAASEGAGAGNGGGPSAEGSQPGTGAADGPQSRGAAPTARPVSQAARDGTLVLALLRRPAVLRLLIRTLFRRPVPTRPGEAPVTVGLEAAASRKRRAACAQLLAAACTTWPVLGEPAPRKGEDFEACRARVEEVSPLLQGALEPLMQSEEGEEPPRDGDLEAAAAATADAPGAATAADTIAATAQSHPILCWGVYAWAGGIARQAHESASDKSVAAMERIDACYHELALALPAIARIFAATARCQVALRKQRLYAFRGAPPQPHAASLPPHSCFTRHAPAADLVAACSVQRATTLLKRGGAMRVVIEIAVLSDATGTCMRAGAVAAADGPGRWLGAGLVHSLTWLRCPGCGVPPQKAAPTT